MTRVINMWAAPRNVSTAMMYAWNERPDTTAIDEPMYAHYLVVTGIDHPLRDEVLAVHPSEEDVIVGLMLNDPYPTPLLFIKNMAHHLEGMDTAIIDEMDNFILTRDPASMLPSLMRGLGSIPSMKGTGYAAQVEIVERILASGRHPIVVDSTTLLNTPESTLRALCRALDVPFDPVMLSWEAGPKDIDGVWGPHWYKRLHKTTGFEAGTQTGEPVPADLMDLYTECKPLYERMTRFAIG